MPILSLANSSKPKEKLTLTTGAKRILQAIYWQKNKKDDLDPDTPRIRVSDMVSKMAFFYEKICNSVDYREEYLLRKEAIFRIIKRLLVIEGVLTGRSEADPVKMARSLLIELIRAGYLPNNQLPEAKIVEVALLIHKYIVLRDLALERVGGSGKFVIADFSKSNKKDKIDDKNELNTWIIGLMAAEIEENLSASQSIDTIVAVMNEVLNKAIKLPPEIPYECDLPIQIILGIYRNFLKLNDYSVLSFILFKYFNEDWLEPTEQTVERIADRLDDLKSAIDYQIDHPLMSQLNKVIQQYTVYFTILNDVVEKDPKKSYDMMEQDSGQFIRQLREATNKRYQESKKKLWKNAIRSIIYIFLTKSVFVLLIEVPANAFFGETVNAMALSINIAFPAFLLFMSVALMRLPGDDNTAKIVSGVEELVYAEKARKQPIFLRAKQHRGQVISFIFNTLYAATFLLSFGLVVWSLRQINFTPVSIIIFLFFLVFVSFFIMRIRRGAVYWVVVEPKENIWTFLWSFVSVPVVSAGKWLSGKFSKYNFIVFFLDFIIEAPFKVLVSVTEEWTKYLRERRESIS